ncbi:MAG TPA: cupredoxin domain-containing protein [Candidatus Paceibacterota bacterium]|nr:cupredoxin domain-containing protein [Candidatus Paceibacterota bacterium]
MKKTYLWIVVLIVLVAIAWIAMEERREVTAPSVVEEISNEDASDETENTVTEVSADAEVKEFVIEGNNFAFVPNTMEVKKGDKVKVVFKSTEGFHDFVIDEYGAATKQLRAPAEEVLEFTADKVGTFEYYCSVGTHRQMGMVGTLTVTE